MENMESNSIQDLTGRHIILGEVFCYLTHTQKLISRLVCKDWNSQLSSILASTSRFSLMCRDTNQVLIDSNVLWTKIKVPDYSSPLLPADLKNAITSLHVDISAAQDEFVDFENFLIQFPNLIDLRININGDMQKLQKSVRTSELVNFIGREHVQLMTKLKDLSVTFPKIFSFSTSNSNINCTTLRRLFEGCILSGTGGNVKLAKLSLREGRKAMSSTSRRNPIGYTPDQTLPEPVSLINLLISQSAQTLKYLDLNFYSKQYQDVLFPSMISPLFLPPPPNSILESFFIRSDPIAEDYDRDFSIHQEFLATQFNSAHCALKHTILPWCPTATRCQEFVRTLPEDIESVENVRQEHITQDFPANFKKLKFLSIVREKHLGDMFDGVGQCPSVRRVQILFRNRDNANRSTSNRYRSLYTSMTTSLINLTELHIILYDLSFDEHDLQDIIKQFTQLRVLRVECDGDYTTNSFTDFSVTGIDPNYIEKLGKTKRFQLGKEFEIPRVHMDGLPLSSLRMLETLVLPVTTISDLGIIYGLQFGSVLKHLTFASKLVDDNELKMSEWGLHWLGAGNPALESFEGKIWSEHISDSGAEILKKRLPLLQFTGKFKLEIKSPEDD